MPQIKNLADPTDPQDAATKNYVDTGIAHGYIYSATGLPNTPVVNNVWTKLLATTISTSLSSFDTGALPTNNLLRYTGVPNIVVSASANICCACNVSGFYMGMSFFKNGSMVPGSDLYFIVQNSIFTNISINSFIPLITNDSLEIYVLVSANATVIPLGLNNFMQFSVQQV